MKNLLNLLWLGLVCLILTFTFSACGGETGSGGGSWSGVKGQFLNEDGSNLAIQGAKIKLFDYDSLCIL